MTPEILKLLESGGPVAMAAIIAFFWKQERADKIHYREINEANYKEIPKLTYALEKLTDEVSRRNQESIPPKAQ